MSFHAYTKRQFAALGFDTSPYRMLKGSDYGAACGRLDCKRWGGHCMFVYLTLDRGDKIITPVFQQNPTGVPYMGFMDIPIGAIVDLEILAAGDGERGRLIYAEWLPNETDPKKRSKSCWVSLALQRMPVRRFNEHRLCTDKAGAVHTARGAAPGTPN